MNISAWLRQPTTINGISALVGLGSSVLGGVITHQITHDPDTVKYAAGGLGLFVGAVVHLLLPDNSAEQSATEKLVADAVAAAASRRLAQALPVLIQDGMAVVGAIGAAPPPSPPPSPPSTPAAP